MKKILIPIITFIVGGVLTYFILREKKDVVESHPSTIWPKVGSKISPDSIPILINSIRKKFLSDSATTQLPSLNFSEILLLGSKYSIGPVVYKAVTYISAPSARAGHLEYLRNGPWIYNKDGDIVRFLKVESAELANLASRGSGGARIYFCKETDGSLNLILVPIKSTDTDNELVNPIGGKSNIVNTLEPCPRSCFTVGGYNSMNDLNYDAEKLYPYSSPLGVKYWYDPNYLASGAWVDEKGAFKQPK